MRPAPTCEQTVASPRSEAYTSAVESNADTTLRLPQCLETLFWDCDPRALTWERNRAFIIRRVLDRGDWQAMQWLRQAVGDGAIRDWFLTKRGRGLDPRKLRFWALILDLPEQEVDERVREARQSTWHRRVAR